MQSGIQSQECRLAPLACIAFVLLTSCSSTPRPSCYEAEDPLVGATFQWCGNNPIANDSLPMRPGDVELMSLTPVRAELGGRTTYFVRLHYQGPAWAPIEPGSQLRLDLEGQAEPLILTTPAGVRGDSMREVRGRFTNARSEAADYPADADIIRSISRAASMRVSFTSGQRPIETQLLASGLAPFREFVANYLPAR